MLRDAMEDVLNRKVAAPLELNGLEDFDAVVEAHKRRIYRLLLGMVRDPDAAETLMQDCFLRAYRSRSSYRGDASVATWLAGIAINLARDHARNRRIAFWKKLFSSDENGESAHERVADRGATPERELLAREELNGVWAAVETLSQKQRAVFLLRFVEEMSLEEIGQSTGMKVATVKTHLFRAVSAVRKKMKGNSQ